MLNKALLIALALAPGAYALCPKACSGHGQCKANDRCECYDNFQGNACDERVCAFGVAWSTEGGDHAYAECSNRGACDRSSGLCECNDGFGGKACARLLCPEDCSGHGTCETLNRINSAYAAWDKDMIQHCDCDPGYEGIDCSSRTCPEGDDPLSTMQLDSPTSPQSNEVQVFTLSGSGALPTGEYVLKFTDWRGEEWRTWALDADATALQVEEALEALPNHAIPNVTVTKEADSDPNRQWRITFIDTANSGDVTELEAHIAGCSLDGCQPRYNGVTGTSQITDGTPSVGSAGIKGTTERTTCSGRGTCNTDDGVCECYDGYKGRACEKQTIIL